MLLLLIVINLHDNSKESEELHEYVTLEQPNVPKSSTIDLDKPIDNEIKDSKKEIMYLNY